MRWLISEIATFYQQVFCYHFDRVRIDNDLEVECKTMKNGTELYRTRLHIEYQCPDCDHEWTYSSGWGPWKQGRPPGSCNDEGVFYD